MLQTEQEHLLNLCQWYVSLCVHIGTFPCKVIAFLNPGQKNNVRMTRTQWFQDSLESDEDLLISNRHPHCLTIFNPGRNWYRHLVLQDFLTLLVKWGRLRPSFYGWLDHGLYSQNKDSCSMFPCPGTAWLRSWSDMNHQHHFHAWDMPSNLQVLLIMKGPVDTVSIPVPLQPGHLEGHIIKKLSNCFPVN